MYWILWLIIAPVVCLFYPTKIIGKKYLKRTKKKAAIVCSNHQTNIDAFIFKVRIGPKLKIMGKKSLFKTKLGSWFFTTCHAYPVDRGQADIKAVKTTLGHLKSNNHVLIFPEGTRVQNAESMDMKAGVVTFALKTDSYIVPTYFRKVTNPFVFNTLMIGKPFKFSEMEEFKDKKVDKELISKANEILSEKLNYLKTVNIKEYKKQLKNEFKKTKNDNK